MEMGQLVGAVSTEKAMVVQVLQEGGLVWVYLLVVQKPAFPEGAGVISSVGSVRGTEPCVLTGR